MHARWTASPAHDPSDPKGRRKHEEESGQEKVDVAGRKLEARSNEIRRFDQPESNNQICHRHAPELPLLGGPEEDW